jgi:hypothetical protein
MSFAVDVKNSYPSSLLDDEVSGGVCKKLDGVVDDAV